MWYSITNIIVEGALGAANQLYLETHGYRRDDGEAPDLFAMNVQGMRGTSTGMRDTNRAVEEPTCMSPDNSHAHDGEAPDLFAMNVQGMRGTNRTEEVAYMTPDNSHAQQAQAPTLARPPRKRRRRLRKCIDSSSDGDEDLRESESEHEDLRESESEHD